MKTAFGSSPSASKRELLDGILSSDKFGDNDAHDCEHAESAVVQLAVAHLLVVAAGVLANIAHAHWITKVAGLLVGVLFPDTNFQGACSDNKSDGTKGAGAFSHCTQTRRNLLKARELHIV